MRFLAYSVLDHDGETVLENNEFLRGYRPEIVDGDLFVTVESLTELLELQKKAGCDIIIGKHWDNMRLEIYDTWRE